MSCISITDFFPPSVRLSLRLRHSLVPSLSLELIICNCKKLYGVIYLFFLGGGSRCLILINRITAEQDLGYWRILPIVRACRVSLNKQANIRKLQNFAHSKVLVYISSKITIQVGGGGGSRNLYDGFGLRFMPSSVTLQFCRIRVGHFGFVTGSVTSICPSVAWLVGWLLAWLV